MAKKKYVPIPDLITPKNRPKTAKDVNLGSGMADNAKNAILKRKREMEKRLKEFNSK